MNEARERSRNAQNKQGAASAIVMDADATSALHKRGIATTNDSFKFTWFQDHNSVIKAIYTGMEYVESAAFGDEVGIILESTSFYGEQGGQPELEAILSNPAFTARIVEIFRSLTPQNDNGSENGGNERDGENDDNNGDE